MSRRAFALALASLAALLAPLAIAAPGVRALDVAPQPSSMGIVPVEGSVAPRNTRVWVTYSETALPGGPDVALIDQTGTRVPLRASVLRLASESRWWWRMLVLAPSEPLAPDARYTVHVRKRDGELALPAQTFMTAAAVDLEAPAVPVVEDVQYTPPQKNARCGTGESLTVTLSADAWIVQRAPNAAAYEPFDPGAPSGAVQDFVLAAVGGATQLSPIRCGHDGSPHGAMQLGTFDLAGNFSGWGPRVPFGDDGCRVRAPGARAGGWQPAAALAAVLLALRIRRTPARERRRAR